ncbi:MAG: insulinase family protein [Firmicutes bacterium]|nr:insulinase family protein [Bacillota bacterium]
MATGPQPFPTVPPPLAPERPVAWPRRTVRTLSNGLRIVLVESHTIPRISIELIFRSGNAAALHIRPGLAEITAAVVRTGTASRTGPQIEEWLRRMGAELSTSAGADSTAIALSGLAEFAEGLLELADDLARNASFPPEEFERERRQMLEELRIQRTTPAFLAAERLRRVLFGAHPYGIAAPAESDVAAYRREELEQFYREHYVAGDAVLLAVGDFSTDRLLEFIEQRFGAWPAQQPPGLPSAQPPECRGRRVYLVDLPGAVQAQLLVGNRAITRPHPDWLRLAVANAIYGGAFHSRLVMNLREQKGYTYSPRSSVHALREHGYLAIGAAVRNEVVAASLAEIFCEVDRLRALPVAEEELTEIQQYLCGVFALGLATQEGLLNQLATVYLHDLPEEYLETYRERVRAVRRDDVLAAARRYFDSPNMQIVLVGDRTAVAEPAALFGEVEFYDAQGNRTE